MDFNLNADQGFRISCDMRNNFIDVRCLKHELGLAVDGYKRFHYIEIREKENNIRTFYFKNKRAKKELDLGWWADAEVIFTRNEIKKD